MLTNAVHVRESWIRDDAVVCVCVSATYITKRITEILVCHGLDGLSDRVGKVSIVPTQILRNTNGISLDRHVGLVAYGRESGSESESAAR